MIRDGDMPSPVFETISWDSSVVESQTYVAVADGYVRAFLYLSGGKSIRLVADYLVNTCYGGSLTINSGCLIFCRKGQTVQLVSSGVGNPSTYDNFRFYYSVNSAKELGLI